MVVPDVPLQVRSVRQYRRFALQASIFALVDSRIVGAVLDDAPPFIARIRPMRRWLAIFLLVLLPVQLGWAAVGVYCAHESGAAADHFGHHDHRHSVDDNGNDKGSLPKGAHADCASCHGIGASVLLSDASAHCPDHLTSLSIDMPLAWPLAEHPAEPERPKWARPA